MQARSVHAIASLPQQVSNELKIVPWESAAFGSNFADVIEVDKDHSGLNKSLNSEDPLYKELTAQLCRMKP